MKFTECAADLFLDAVREAWEEYVGDEGANSSFAARLAGEIYEDARGHDPAFSDLLTIAETYFDSVGEAKRMFVYACKSATREQMAINLDLNRMLGLAASGKAPVFSAPSPAALGAALRGVQGWYGEQVGLLQAKFRASCAGFEEACNQLHHTFRQEVRTVLASHGLPLDVLDAAARADLPAEDDEAYAVALGYATTLAEVEHLMRGVWSIAAAAPAAWGGPAPGTA
ncbi:hypothetical protein ACFQ78_36760 [Streptomyces sp. NPDC056519]|uniref:hypothetical protein n=1 Tax=Streptomyces sp. NPDC056519 TaxID=3345849 RepID=UPI0036796112